MGTAEQDNSSVGLALGVVQVIPLSQKSLLTGSLSTSVSQNVTKTTTSKDKTTGFQVTPEISYAYLFNHDWSCALSASVTLADDSVTISNSHGRYDLGAGVRYNLNSDVNLNARYVRESGPSHIGNKIVFGATQNF